MISENKEKEIENLFQNKVWTFRKYKERVKNKIKEYGYIFDTIQLKKVTQIFYNNSFILNLPEKPI